MRHRLFQENHARDCQAIEELRRICWEKKQIEQDKQELMNCVRNPTTVSQYWLKIQDSQNKVNSLPESREFYDPETASSSGATHIPSQPLIILSPRNMSRCDSGLPHDTRNFWCTSGNVFERPPAQEGRSSTFFKGQRIWQLLLKN